MGRSIFVVLFLFFCVPVCAQTRISGKILDKEQKAISGVSVSYSKIGSSVLLGFTQTDREGKFKLEFTLADTDSVQLNLRHMSYKNESVRVVNASAQYAYVLTEQKRLIDEVKVGDIPVYKRKDTINYSVESFASKQDRVIGDIIKKLPGIEMRGDQIFYQGKPIMKYMVNNLDLMEGRYSMINKNLPVDAVKKVQVVENDQPIKILDSLVFSDQASLNLDLKKFTSTGTGKVGAGVSPALWNLNLTPMTFGKTFQMLNSFQTNNVGYDASQDLRPFYMGSGGYFQNFSQLKDGETYIHLRNVSSPGFDQKKWLDNKIFLFSTNVLQKLQNGLELKGNVSYFDDTRQRQGFTATQYFTDGEVISSSEAVHNRYRSNVLDVGVLLEKNEKQVYLRNRFDYHKRWSRDRGQLVFNEDVSIGQRVNYTDEALLNTLSLARFIGKQLVNIHSSLEWHRTPQRLSVTPGQFEDLLNEGQSYEQMDQHVRYGDLRWNNSLGFMRRVKRWTFSPNFALNYTRSELDTYIGVREMEEEEILGEGYRNEMHNSQLNLSPHLRVGWENQRWKLNLMLPYHIYYFNVRQQGMRTLDKELHHTFNPSVGATYMLNTNNELSGSVSGGQTYGGLNNFYNGYIIGQYRSMQRYDARLLKTNAKNLRIGYNYKNTLKANFANLSYSYSQTDRDYIFTTHIDPQGRMTSAILDRQSEGGTHRLAGGLSRFFSSIKTVAKLNGSFVWNKYDYLLNEVMYVQKIKSRSASLEVINSFSDVVSGDYKTDLGMTHTQLLAGRQNKVFYNNHYLNVTVYPREKHALTLSNSLYRNNMVGQKDQFFMDVGYRYRLEKWKTDVEFTAQNLLNNSRYTQQFTSNIELVQSYFELRPRQFLISTHFKF